MPDKCYDYELEVIRTVSETRLVRVTAPNRTSAENQALVIAGNINFDNPGAVEYSIGSVMRNHICPES